MGFTSRLDASLLIADGGRLLLPRESRVPVHEDAAFRLLGVEVEGGFSSAVDADGEVEEAEAGVTSVFRAAFELELD